MPTHLPGRPRNLKVEIIQQPKEEKKNDFTEKLFSTFTTVAVTAILYFTGWVYLAHWYGYYGIDASQIDISLQLILLHGFPGILLLFISALISAIFFAFYKEYRFRSSINIEDAPNIIILGYFLSLIPSIIALSAIIREPGGITIPSEIGISAATLFILFFIYILVRQSRSIIELTNTSVVLTTAEHKDFPSLINVLIRRIIEAIFEYGLTAAANLLKKIFIEKDEETNAKIRDDARRVREFSETENNKIIYAIQNSRKVWVLAVLLFYLLISVSSSALLGEWDAARGGRLLVGDWHIPKVTLYSTGSIKSLQSYEIILTSTTTTTATTILGTPATTTATTTDTPNTEFRYESLGLLASTDKVYYLVDFKTTDYYKAKPKVYIIPRSDSLTLNFIVIPYAPQPPTPIPTSTNTPTLTPTIATTPTP